MGDVQRFHFKPGTPRQSVPLVPSGCLPRSSAHIAAIARRVQHLPLKRDDLLLQPADAKFVFVLHSAKALLQRADIAPDIIRVLAHDVAYAATGGAAMAGETTGIGSGSSSVL